MDEIYEISGSVNIFWLFRGETDRNVPQGWERIMFLYGEWKKIYSNFRSVDVLWKNTIQPFSAKMTTWSKLSTQLITVSLQGLTSGSHLM